MHRSSTKPCSKTAPGHVENKAIGLPRWAQSATSICRYSPVCLVGRASTRHETRAGPTSVSTMQLQDHLDGPGPELRQGSARARSSGSTRRRCSASTPPPGIARRLHRVRAAGGANMIVARRSGLRAQPMLDDVATSRRSPSDSELRLDIVAASTRIPERSGRSVA